MAWFQKKVEVHLIGEDGKPKTVKVPEKQLDQWVAEGKLKLLDEDQVDKEAMINEFSEIIANYELSPPKSQIAVAIGLAITWKAFNARFGSVEEFTNISRKEQIEYMKLLDDYQTLLLSKGLVLDAVGPMLMKMYLAPLIEGDHDLAQQMAMKLEPINQKGWPLAP